MPLLWKTWTRFTRLFQPRLQTFPILLCILYLVPSSAFCPHVCGILGGVVAHWFAGAKYYLCSSYLLHHANFVFQIHRSLASTLKIWWIHKTITVGQSTFYLTLAIFCFYIKVSWNSKLSLRTGRQNVEASITWKMPCRRGKVSLWRNRDFNNISR